MSQQHRNKWFVEPITADFMHVSALNKIEYSGKSKFQEIDVMELGSFGRCLVLDNKIQSCEKDEAAYHETLVHASMLSFSGNEGKGPKRVFIGGGGEGATSREVLRVSCELVHEFRKCF